MCAHQLNSSSCYCPLAKVSTVSHPPGSLPPAGVSAALLSSPPAADSPNPPRLYGAELLLPRIVKGCASRCFVSACRSLQPSREAASNCFLTCRFLHSCQVGPGGSTDMNLAKNWSLRSSCAQTRWCCQHYQPVQPLHASASLPVLPQWLRGCWHSCPDTFSGVRTPGTPWLLLSRSCSCHFEWSFHAGLVSGSCMEISWLDDNPNKLLIANNNNYCY